MGSEPKRGSTLRDDSDERGNYESVERSKAARGQTIVRSYGRDDSSMSVPGATGQKIGGSVTNLSHSLSGSSAVQELGGKKAGMA